MIKELESYFICIGANGWPFYETIAKSMFDSMEKLKVDKEHDFKFYQNTYGYRCIKVNIQFTEVK